MMEEAFRGCARRDLCANGHPIHAINTLYQLLAMVVQKSCVLAAADKLLMMPISLTTG